MASLINWISDELECQEFMISPFQFTSRIMQPIGNGGFIENDVNALEMNL